MRQRPHLTGGGESARPQPFLSNIGVGTQGCWSSFEGDVAAAHHVAPLGNRECDRVLLLNQQHRPAAVFQLLQVLRDPFDDLRRQALVGHVDHETSGASIYCRGNAPGDVFRPFAERTRASGDWQYFKLEASHNPHITMPDTLADPLHCIATSEHAAMPF